jgi:polar amino acid transport system substrate-binding protein
MQVFGCDGGGGTVALSVSATNDEVRAVVFAGIPEEPFRYANTEGRVVGIDVDIIDAVCGRLGIPYRVLLVASSARLEKLWLAGTEIDAVLTLSRRRERMQHLAYPEESHLTTTYHFFLLKKNEGRFRYETFEDLRGLRVGVTRGFSYTPAFLEAVEQEVFQPDFVARNDLQMQKLLRERIDLAPLPDSVALFRAVKEGYRDRIAFLPKPLKSTPYYNAFVKRSTHPRMPELRAAYDAELGRLREEGVLAKIFEQHGIR